MLIYWGTEKRAHFGPVSTRACNGAVRARELLPVYMVGWYSVWIRQPLRNPLHLLMLIPPPLFSPLSLHTSLFHQHTSHEYSRWIESVWIRGNPHLTPPPLSHPRPLPPSFFPHPTLFIPPLSPVYWPQIWIRPPPHSPLPLHLSLPYLSTPPPPPPFIPPLSPVYWPQIWIRPPPHSPLPLHFSLPSLSLSPPPLHPFPFPLPPLHTCLLHHHYAYWPWEIGT